MSDSTHVLMVVANLHRPTSDHGIHPEAVRSHLKACHLHPDDPPWHPLPHTWFVECRESAHEIAERITDDPAFDDADQLMVLDLLSPNSSSSSARPQLSRWLQHHAGDDCARFVLQYDLAGPDLESFWRDEAGAVHVMRSTWIVDTERSADEMVDRFDDAGMPGRVLAARLPAGALRTNGGALPDFADQMLVIYNHDRPATLATHLRGLQTTDDERFGWWHNMDSTWMLALESDVSATAVLASVSDVEDGRLVDPRFDRMIVADFDRPEIAVMGPAQDDVPLWLDQSPVRITFGA